MKKVSQQVLSEKMGVSRQTMNSIENGKYLPSLLLGMKLSEYFGCRVEELFEMEEEDWKND
jgi:putative transcriptional regulator